MNSTTPYEKLLAAKLDQVPVPHLEDSIWASIGAQLDALGGMPDHHSDAPDNHQGNHPDNTPDSNQHTTPDNQEPAPENHDATPDTTPDHHPAPGNSPDATPTQSAFPKSWSWYGLGGIIAITTAVWFLNPKPNQSSNQKITTDTTEQISIPNPIPVPDTLPKTDTPQLIPVNPLPAPLSVDTPVVKDTILPPPEFESGPQRVLPLFVPDSLPAKPVPPTVPDQIPVPVKPAPPKPRGVKGITSDDYKISVNKDSTKRAQ